MVMSRLRLKEVVSSVWSSHNRSALWRSNEALIVGLQAACRGFLVRQGVEARRRFLIRQTPAVVIIQVSIIIIIITVPPPRSRSVLEMEVLKHFRSIINKPQCRWRQTDM